MIQNRCFYKASSSLLKCAFQVCRGKNVTLCRAQKPYRTDSFRQLIYLQTCYYSSKKTPEEELRIAKLDSFASVDDKNKDTYLEMVRIYKGREKYRRGHVEFIYAALKYMKEYGVDKDLETYKALIDVMPKGKFVPQNIIQAEFQHYPKQQQCIIDLLEQMEENGVIPDTEMELQLVNIFGMRSHPVKRYQRMMYWMSKFKHASPFPLPNPVPNDALELAKLAIQQITGVDITTKISVLQTEDVEDSLDKTWIVSGQSDEQRSLLSNHPKTKPVFVEGPYIVWLRNVTVTYFVLRGDLIPQKLPEIDPDDVSHLFTPLFSNPRKELSKEVMSVHKQEDGVYYAVCATGTSSRDSLLSWIRLLEKENPKIGELPVLFTLRSPGGDEQEEVLQIPPDYEQIISEAEDKKIEQLVSEIEDKKTPNPSEKG